MFKWNDGEIYQVKIYKLRENINMDKDMVRDILSRQMVILMKFYYIIKGRV